MHQCPYIPLRVKGNYQGVVGGIPITTNSHGFRDELEFDPTPPAGEFRILSMGDSIAFGLTLDSSDTYAKVLERHSGCGASTNTPFRPSCGFRNEVFPE